MTDKQLYTTRKRRIINEDVKGRRITTAVRLPLMVVGLSVEILPRLKAF